MEIILHNNITHQAITDELPIKISKEILCNLQAIGYDEDFCYEAAAVAEWLYTLNQEDYEAIKQLIKVLK